MSVAKSLMQVPFEKDGSAALIALANCCRRFGPSINRCRSVVLRVALVLSLILFGVDPLRMRTVAYTRFRMFLLTPEEAIGH